MCHQFDVKTNTRGTQCRGETPFGWMPLAIQQRPRRGPSPSGTQRLYIPCMVFFHAAVPSVQREEPVPQFGGSGAAKAAVLIPVLLAFYVLPTLLAWLRSHPRRLSITVINLLLGWTGIGWVASMLMNFAYSAPPEGTSDEQHLPGDSVS